MSREDPQFKLRMPLPLRRQAEQAAKAAGRSLNAELVARLEASFLSESPSEELLPAKRARELALMARNGIPDEVRRRTIEAITRAVKLGRSEAMANLNDLHLDSGIPDSELDELLKGVMTEFKDAGYKINWDDITALWIEF
ncbi:Arc family DNA-binding protein [Pseudomonas aeruginosa]|uniref:Arc family DNA-binding protein n=1 Tax=Pseudomonas aeruginosa TaxID=287 RepID=UPI000F8196D4|nr:Arc family DNA-binding protein [Pseudomonas aeruginosa]RTS19941.1 Arc family DNA-binding protein [Pseudomonas aeruginosa]TEG23327.1 Arc family DNA-binding protein [Pseudomonas aeruginosa]TEG49366.1 Arc family DNA-binding protein [Pseudomonas aeruginosa]HBN8442188.1 Arc family DNA-binding protein [Pseudomonas aeruginosa]HCA6674991.1 Arc family DNA-binding protein [Pseudomonas aeruginosa]